MLTRRSRRHSSGAAALLCVVVALLILLAAMATAQVLAASLTQARADAAADAAAHAAVGFFAADRSRDELSVELQAQNAACDLDPRHDVGPGVADQNLNGAIAFTSCARSIRAAADAAGANRGRLVSFHAGPDPRDYTSAGGGTRIDVLVSVSVDGPLASVRALCDGTDSKKDLCFALAWSAAEEAG